MKSAWKMVISAVVAVIVIAVAAIAYGLIQDGQTSPVADPTSAMVKEAVDTGSGPQNVELLYFHRTDRCTSCNNAEQYARDTLDKYYEDEMQSGKITFRSIDYQQDKATSEQYNVKVQGLKIKTTAGNEGKVKDVPQIWSYVSDKDAYMSYLKSAIDEELER